MRRVTQPKIHYGDRCARGPLLGEMITLPLPLKIWIWQGIFLNILDGPGDIDLVDPALSFLMMLIVLSFGCF